MGCLDKETCGEREQSYDNLSAVMEMSITQKRRFSLVPKIHLGLSASLYRPNSGSRAGKLTSNNTGEFSKHPYDIMQSLQGKISVELISSVASEIQDALLIERDDLNFEISMLQAAMDSESEQVLSPRFSPRSAQEESPGFDTTKSTSIPLRASYDEQIKIKPDFFPGNTNKIILENVEGLCYSCNKMMLITIPSYSTLKQPSVISKVSLVGKQTNQEIKVMIYSYKS